LVFNPDSGRRYRVTIRGAQAGDNHCSGPGFATNDLGTCKHVEFTLARISAGAATRAHSSAVFADRSASCSSTKRSAKSLTTFQRPYTRIKEALIDWLQCRVLDLKGIFISENVFD
jgi:hypothetical protein